MYMPTSEDRIKKHFFALYITASVLKITTKSLKRGKNNHFRRASGATKPMNEGNEGEEKEKEEKAGMKGKRGRK
jgi:hypothetical protein